ncbi:unnamed protein product, partial [Owenia fusiformis]
HIASFLENSMLRINTSGMGTSQTELLSVGQSSSDGMTPSPTPVPLIVFSEFPHYHDQDRTKETKLIATSGEDDEFTIELPNCNDHNKVAYRTPKLVRKNTIEHKKRSHSAGNINRIHNIPNQPNENSAPGKKTQSIADSLKNLLKLKFRKESKIDSDSGSSEYAIDENGKRIWPPVKRNSFNFVKAIPRLDEAKYLDNTLFTTFSMPEALSRSEYILGTF